MFKVSTPCGLCRRVLHEHKNDCADGFTKRYKVHNPVWYEAHETAESAIQREKKIKKWERNWKLKLIERQNPEWNDLYSRICEDTGFPLKTCGNDVQYAFHGKA